MPSTQIKATDAAKANHWTIRDEAQLSVGTWIRWVKGDHIVQADFDNAGRCTYAHRHNVASDISDPIPTGTRSKTLLAWLSA